MLKLENIYKIYENGTVAVRNASLELPFFGMVAIVGTSGCGKSTILNLLSNNDKPSKGNILYNDKNYNEIENEILTKDFAYIYQDFKLIENISVYQNIRIGYELASKDIDNNVILDIAEKLGIREILDEKVYSLSGGQQQRVAIARALVRQPKVIFADEPTGNLDSENSKNVYEIFKEISKDILVVIVTHDRAIVEYADRIIEMQNGKILSDVDTKSTKNYELTNKQQNNNIDNNNILNIEKYDIVYKRAERQKKIEHNKKITKINSKSIFSSEKSKSKSRKKQGLSFNSTLGLTIAFNNKGIGKKVVLIVISIVMMALIFLTTTMLVSDSDRIFYNAMKSNKAPFVTYTIAGYDSNHEGNSYNLNQKEFEQLNEYIKNKHGANTFAYSTHNLHAYLSDVCPIDNDKYNKFNRLYLSSCNAVFTDNPSDVGLELIKGVAPKINSEGIDEIAISKTYYNYFLDAKKFVNSDGQIVEFNDESDLIGKYIDAFHFKITGVFEDYNDVSPYEIIKSKTENHFDYLSYNNLIELIVRPNDTEILNDLSMMNSDKKLHVKDTLDVFSSLLPNSSYINNYFYKVLDGINIGDLADDEIIVGNNAFLKKYKENTGKELQIGDEIELDFVETEMQLSSTRIVKIIKPAKKFKVKYIFNNFARLNSNSIIVNEKIFNEWTQGERITSMCYAINSKHIKPNVLKDIRKYAYYEISENIANVIKNDLYNEGFNIEYSSTKYVSNSEYNNGVIKIAQLAIALPLLILSSIAFIVIISVLVSDMIKAKGKDILTLKSLGAKSRDIIMLFAVIILIVAIMQIVFGTIIGGLLTYGLNVFWTAMSNYNFYVVTFAISVGSVLLAAAVLILIYSFSLWLNAYKLNGKNLRKAFQKQKK